MKKAFLFIFLMFMYGYCYADDMTELLLTCAPNVHPDTMGAIVSHESRSNYLVIGDNGDFKQNKSDRVLKTYYPSSLDEAVGLASLLIKSGHVIDIGLGQLNSRNLQRLGMSLYDAFDPCKNLWGAQVVLVEFYLDAAKKYGPGRVALLAAISAYNTGSYINGFKNGYVSKVLKASNYSVPSLNTGTEKQRANSTAAVVTNVTRPLIKSKSDSRQVRLAEAINAPGNVRNWGN